MGRHADCWARRRGELSSAVSAELGPAAAKDVFGPEVVLETAAKAEADLRLEAELGLVAVLGLAPAAAKLGLAAVLEPAAVLELAAELAAELDDRNNLGLRMRPGEEEAGVQVGSGSGDILRSSWELSKLNFDE